MSKITLTLVVMCAIQYISANALPVEESTKLIQAKKELITEIKLTGIKITSSKKDVNDDTHSIKDNIKDELKKLKKIVKQAEKDTKHSGKNIKSCVKAEKNYAEVIDNNLKHLEDCEETKETNEAGAKLNEVRALQGVLEHAFNKCAQSENTSKCVDDTIKTVQEKTKNIERVIDDILQNVDTSTQDECVAYSKFLLEKKVEKLNKDWNKCIA